MMALPQDRGVDDLGGERVQVQLTGVVDADRAVGVGEQRLKVVEVAGHLGHDRRVQRRETTSRRRGR